MIKPGDIVRVSKVSSSKFAGAIGIVIDVNRGAFDVATVYFSDRHTKPFLTSVLSHANPPN